jgi:alanyl-tRNA synthetase
VDDLVRSAVTVGAVRLIAAGLEGVTADVARTMNDQIKEKNPDAVIILAVTAGGKLNFVAAAGKDAVAHGAHAGKLVGAVAAVTGGKGGGRPDNAMAGGQDASKIGEALASAEGTLKGMLK